MKSASELLNQLLETTTDDIYCNLPCRVEKVNGNFVDVKVYINDEEPDIVLYNVPIQRQETQRAYIFLGIKQGDRGTLKFFDRSVEGYLGSDFDFNSDERQHDINDRCFELGFVPDKEAFAYPVQNDVVTVDNLIADFNSDNFNTELTHEEEIQFLSWFYSMKSQGYIPVNDSGYDYDYRGAFKSGFSPSEVGGHWLDTWKKPNHETFSNESIYATGEYKKYAGSWDGDEYIAPDSRIMPNPEIEFGLKSGVCKISINADGSFNIISNTGVNITTPLLTINGDLAVTGEVVSKYTTDNPIPLSTHKHLGVRTGNQTSGLPTT